MHRKSARPPTAAAWKVCSTTAQSDWSVFLMAPTTHNGIRSTTRSSLIITTHSHCKTKPPIKPRCKPVSACLSPQIFPCSPLSAASLNKKVLTCYSTACLNYCIIPCITKFSSSCSVMASRALKKPSAHWRNSIPRKSQHRSASMKSSPTLSKVALTCLSCHHSSNRAVSTRFTACATALYLSYAAPAASRIP